jgi:hypothetical protein
VVRKGQNVDEVLVEMSRAICRVSTWLKESGLKVNESKTELCIFHRNEKQRKTIMIGENEIKSGQSMIILGLVFEENLNWKKQIENAISGANQVLFAIKIIKGYFTLQERKNLITSLFFSKLYYGSEVWHLPDLPESLKKSLKKCSANALKICLNGINQFTTHTEIHNLAERSLPHTFCLYKHALLMYKLFNSCVPDLEYFHLNFQLLDNQRSNKLCYRKSINHEAGNNILLNRFAHLNNKIEKDWLNMNFLAYKIRCKALFL